MACSVIGAGDEIQVALGVGGGFALGAAFFTALGALFAPVAPAVVPGDGVEPAILNAFFEGPEADGGGEVETGGGQNAGDQPGALDVEIADEQAGDEASNDTLDGENVQPAPVPRQQAEAR